VTRRAPWAGLALAAWLSPAGALAIDAAAVQQCLAANAPEHSSRYLLGFESHDARGRVAEQRAQVYWRRFPKDERRVLLRLEAPASVAGSALLAIVKPNVLPEIHLYIPELGPPQRIHQVEQLRGFLGRSGVELAELWRMLESTPALAQRLLDADATLSGRKTWAVEGDLEIPRQSERERVVSQVDQATCVPLRVESFDASGNARRRLDVDPAQIVPDGARWLPRELVFADLRDGSSATVKVLSVELDSEIPAALLTRKAMVRGH
jgi:Outer membrane lipoprotein-sorting protein